jgi:hypothetical protein
MLTNSINTVINRFIKPKNTRVIQITLSGLVIAMLIAVTVFACLGCGPDSAEQATGIPEKTASAISARTFAPDPATTGKNLAYYKTDKVASIGKLLTFSIAATDPDGGWLDYSASNLPDGAVFDNATLTFSWTPRFDQAGVYSVTFEVSDGELTDSEDITITVLQLYEDWDVNGDGAANVLDMVLVGQHWGQTGLTGWIREDTNEDGAVDVLDEIVIGQGWTG